MRNDFDVVIGGGGVAGAVAAAALHQLGYRILLVEPGLHDERRLAGEIFHPPGVTGLDALGLLEVLLRAPQAQIKGFTVSSGGSDGEYIRFPYVEVDAHRTSGLGMEHGTIRQYLLNAVSALPQVSVLRGKRVTAIDQTDRSRVIVKVGNGNGSSEHRCRFLVAADGAQSRIGQSVGIGIWHRSISTIFGYRIPARYLSEPDFGEVILGAAAPVLLYPINRHDARILFDIPLTSGRLPRAEDCMGMVSVLSPGLRQEVERAIAAHPRISTLAKTVISDRQVQDRVALVGDAAGTCHPLTASGMTRCVSDALLLRDALAEYPGDLTLAFRNYQSRRRWPQATRLMLADSLRDAFCGASPEARIMRRGIVNYCKANAAGRAATIALLSTADGRLSSLLREVIRATLRGFIAHLRAPMPPDDGGHVSALGLMKCLMVAMLRPAKQLLRNGPAMLRLRQG